MPSWHWTSFSGVANLTSGPDLSSGPKEVPGWSKSEDPRLAHFFICGQFELHERAELAARLGCSVAQSDADLALHAFEKWNDRCAEQLNGQFSFAVWDSRVRKLFACRDHMGTLPFVYYVAGDRLVFAGDMRTLLETGCPRILNPRTLAACVRVRAFRVEPGETLYKDVHSLPPATVLLAGANGRTLRQYWVPAINPEIVPGRPAEVFDKLAHLVETSVRNRIENRRMVAVYLSGGLDSSALTVLAADYLRTRNRSLLALAVVNDSAHPDIRDERAFIEKLRYKENVEFQYVSASGQGPFDDIEDPSRFDVSCLRYSRLFLDHALLDAAAARGVDISLCGAFGELTISGVARPAFLDWAFHLRWGSVLRELRMLNSNTGLGLLRLFASEVWRHCYQRPPSAVSYFLTKGFLKRNPARWVGRSPWWPDVRKTQLKQVTDYLRRDALASTLPPELIFAPSFPFASRDLVEFSLSVPTTCRLKDGYNRYMIRAAFAKMLPPDISWRKGKMPFSPDYFARYNRQIDRARAYVRSIRKSDPVRDIVDIDRLEQSIRTVDLSRGDADAAAPVPQSIYLVNFLRQFPAFHV